MKKTSSHLHLVFNVYLMFFCKENPPLSILADPVGLPAGSCLSKAKVYLFLIGVVQTHQVAPTLFPSPPWFSEFMGLLIGVEVSKEGKRRGKVWLRKTTHTDTHSSNHPSIHPSVCPRTEQKITLSHLNLEAKYVSNLSKTNCFLSGWREACVKGSFVPIEFSIY